MDTKKICFITCVNDENLYQESLLYLHRLDIPSGFRGEYVAIRGAASMAAGYNFAMKQTDAKYKIYMHQDFLLQNKNILKSLLAIFSKNATIGMIGLAGCKKLPNSYCWGEALEKYGCMAHAQETECTTVSKYGRVIGKYTEAEAIDGVFMATQYDIPWREDVFQGWHFYDISASLEFARKGYAVVIPRQSSPWGIHLCGIKELGNDFLHWQRVCQKEYNDDMRK